MNRLRTSITLIATIASVLGSAAVANAAYPPVPPALSAYTCPGGTFSTLAAAETAVETGPAQRYCLADSPTAYLGPLSINRTAAGQATLSAATLNNATIEGGVIHQGGSVKYQGIGMTNASSGAGTNGDCFTEEATVATVEVSYSRVHACNRKAVNQKIGANNLTLLANRFYDVANIDLVNGQAVTIKGPATGGNNQVIANLFENIPDDAIQAQGSGFQALRNLWRNSAACGTCHNDFLQVIPGTTLPGAIIERNRTRNITGTDAHFIYAEGAGALTDTIIRSNELVDIGTASVGIQVGSNTNPGASTNVGIKNNDVIHSGAINFQSGSGGTIYGNVFNACTQSAPWIISSGSSVAISKNTGEGTANCTATSSFATNTATPGFVDLLNRDLHLTSAATLLIDTGLTASPGGSDIDNGARMLDGNGDGISVTDRGAEEFG